MEKKEKELENKIKTLEIQIKKMEHRIFDLEKEKKSTTYKRKEDQNFI
jgi:chaperonin cofactor prefoldin